MNGDRVPTRVIDAPEEPCCFCSEPTKSGIYTRHDPKELACEGTRGPVHEDEG